MATKPFHYQEMFPLGPDTTEYYHLTSDYVHTENWGGQEGVNPHESHQGHAIDCSNCHGVHQQSVMYCNTCHEYEVPEGWAQPQRAADAS